MVGSAASGSAIGAVVERMTRFVMLQHLPDNLTALVYCASTLLKTKTCP